MANFYNENDPFAAAWLRELIKADLIAPGVVDERSIEDIRPDELLNYTQCHFFAGIGGWSYALRLAGWPDNRPVWTGSCPCQPFSAAGKRAGTADERHLWPALFHLAQQCRPGTLFGEQVASKDGLTWFDTVSFDLEAADYTVGATDLCAAGVGAPHIRQRLYFVAYSQRNECRQERPNAGRCDGRSGSEGMEQRFMHGGPGGVEHTPSEQMGLPRCTWFDGRPADWLPCLDGKTRPVEPGTFPLAHGIPARVGRLRGYGNAIVPPLAAAFIEAFMETESTLA